MNPTVQCGHCNGSRVETGELQSTGKVYFRPTDAKFLTLKTANVEVKGRLCLDCGHLELVADAEKVKSLIDGNKAP